MYSAKLISITKPSEEMMTETGAQCAEDIIAFCARVSNPKNQENFATAYGLLTYCMEQKHWSPFEMADMTLEIKCTRDIGRQILRHRSFSFQEFSQRYAKVNGDGLPVVRELRFQDTKNRQNSIDYDPENIEYSNLAIDWQERQFFLWEEAKKIYDWAIANGIAKEQARVVLPEGLTPSIMYMKGSIRSWIHYVQVRYDLATQKEHRWIANDTWKILQKNFKFLQKMD